MRSRTEMLLEFELAARRRASVSAGDRVRASERSAAKWQTQLAAGRVRAGRPYCCAEVSCDGRGGFRRTTTQPDRPGPWVRAGQRQENGCASAWTAGG